MNDDQIKHMVDRFLCWRLPANFRPDNGISYTRPNYAPEVDATPAGTNLFDADQADAMVRHMVEGLPPGPGLKELIAIIDPDFDPISADSIFHIARRFEEAKAKAVKIQALYAGAQEGKTACASPACHVEKRCLFGCRSNTDAGRAALEQGGQS